MAMLSPFRLSLLSSMKVASGILSMSRTVNSFDGEFVRGLNKRWLRIRPEDWKHTLAGNDQQTISILHGDQGEEIYMIGTAHISQKSADQVREVIEHVNPDVVFLELCHERESAFRQAPANFDEKAALMNTIELSMKDQANPMLKQIFASFQSQPREVFKGIYQFLNSLGFVPGVEFRAAIAAVDALRQKNRSKSPEIVFGDLPITKTMEKISKSLSPMDMMRLMMSPPKMSPDLERELRDVFTSSDPNNLSKSIEEGVERLKYRPVVRKTVAFAEGAVPKLIQALLHDRDAHMASGLKDLRGKKVVAVVGLAHMDGIERNWGVTKR